MVTIKTAYEQFLMEKRAIGTCGLYEEVYSYELKDFLRRIDLCMEDYVSVISKEIFNKYVIELRASDLSIATINHNIRSIRVFLYWCMTNELMNQFKIQLVKGQEEKLKFCTDQEVQLLLRAPKKTDSFVEWRTYTIVCFILALGARASTVINIKVSDIDFNSRTVTYRHLKNKKTAVLPISRQLEKVLKEYISMWETSSEYVFCGSDGEQLSVNALKLSLARYCKDRGVSRKGPHSLRHTFARLWIINGGNTFQLQHMLTHSSLEMTRKYVSLFSTDLLKNDFDVFVPLDNLKKPNRKVVRRVWILGISY